MRHQHVVSAALAVLFIGSSSHSVWSQQPKDAIDRIVRRWNERQAQFKSIYVEVSGTQFYPKGRFNQSIEREFGKQELASIGHLPPDDTHQPIQSKFLLDLDRNRCRKEMQWSPMQINEKRFVPKHTTHLFDGKSIRIYEPRDKNTSAEHVPAKGQPDLWLQIPAFSDAFFGNEDMPVFWNCGIVWMSAVELNRLKFPATHRNVIFKGYGEIEGRRCVIVRSPSLSPVNESHYEFWIDVENDCAVLRSQLFDARVIANQLDVRWQRVDGLNVLSEWSYTHFSRTSTGVQLHSRFDLKVDRIIINPETDDSSFDVKAKPGMVLRDVGEDIEGVLASDGKTLLPLSEIDSVSRWILVRTVAYWVGAALFVVAVVWMIRRRWVSRVTS